jgi:hypothetical protein
MPAGLKLARRRKNARRAARSPSPRRSHVARIAASNAAGSATDVCLPECPNDAISQGDEIYIIDPNQPRNRSWTRPMVRRIG